MVLVDTSVWIRFLYNREPYAAELDRLLALDEVVGHELVYGELLVGDRGGLGTLLGAYQRMHQAAPVPHSQVVEFVRHRKLHLARSGLDRHSFGGFGAGWEITRLDGRSPFGCDCQGVGRQLRCAGID